MKSVAFFIYGIQNLKGGGGAERFFADFFDKYSSYNLAQFKVYFVLDKYSLNALSEINKLKTVKNYLIFKVFSNRFKVSLEFLQLFYYILLKQIKIIHLPLYNISYLPLLKKINKIPKIFRPKIVINISNCYVVPGLKNNLSSEINTYYPLFKGINVDGYFSWYQNFTDYVGENIGLFKFKPQVYSITSRFSGNDLIFNNSKKENQIIFASRLDKQKCPDWFIEAIRIIKEKHPTVLLNWKFIVCGDGPMRNQLIETSNKLGLNQFVEFRIEGNLEKVFNYSKIYVSCQEFENFPSLSMAEAMSAGNAIVARNVGQTNLFLNNNVNGLFINPDSAYGLADRLIYLMSNEALLEKMGQKSVELMNTVHTFENFVPQIENFWKKIN